MRFLSHSSPAGDKGTSIFQQTHTYIYICVCRCVVCVSSYECGLSFPHHTPCTNESSRQAKGLNQSKRQPSDQPTDRQVARRADHLSTVKRKHAAWPPPHTYIHTHKVHMPAHRLSTYSTNNCFLRLLCVCVRVCACGVLLAI